MSEELRRILVPIDGSESAHRALRFALMLSRSTGADLRAIHVHHANAVELLGLVVQSKEELDDALRRLSGPILEAARAILIEEGAEAEIDVTIGDPSMEIIEYADKVGAELIVMGSRGRSGLRALLLGSVSHKVLHSARCSVTIVR